MKLLSGEDGLQAIASAGGAANACFALHPDGGYPAAPGARIAKTYAQLSARPNHGRALFDELEREDWRLPEAGRRYGSAEFHAHLRYLVRHERLHVLEFGRLTPDAARVLRADLKAALTRVASGRDGVAQLLHEIERVARYASGRHRANLGNAADAMGTLVGLFAGFALHDAGLAGTGWDRLYDLVREARNHIAHTGTEAVLAETRTKALASVLVEALLGVAREDGTTRLAEVMVADPVRAHGWQTVADVRRTMLVTNFSELPLSGGASGRAWPTVTAKGLAAYLGTDPDERRQRLGRTVDEAVRAAYRPLRLWEAPTAGEDTPVREVWTGAGETTSLPLMVIRNGAGGAALVGIVTWFDLL